MKPAIERLTTCVPNLAALVSSAVYPIHATVADRASVNNLVEDLRYMANPNTLSMRLPCAAHIAGTAQGKALNSVGGDVSGMISCSLYMCSGAQVQEFRQYIAVVLKERAAIFDCPPPGPSDPRSVYREHVLDLCIPAVDDASLKRRLALSKNFTGDITQRRVEVHVPGGSAAIDFDEWASESANILLLAEIVAFPVNAGSIRFLRFGNTLCYRFFIACWRRLEGDGWEAAAGTRWSISLLIGRWPHRMMKRRARQNNSWLRMILRVALKPLRIHPLLGLLSTVASGVLGSNLSCPILPTVLSLLLFVLQSR